MRKKAKWFVVVSILVLGIIWLQSVGFAQEVQAPTPAPMNPAFLKYFENIKANKAVALTAAGHGLGLIPPPVDLSHMKGMKVYQTASLTLPSFYDLRSTGKVTGVRDQGPLGNCWAFATFGSLESCLLPGETDDFSEQNLKNLMSSAYPQGTDYLPNEGGTALMSTAYLARWSGPLWESDDPYNNTGYTVSPTDIPPRKHIHDIDFLPARSSPLDNDNIKTAIMTYGGVFSSFYYDDTYYNPSYYAYYYSGSSSSNHAITLVGWDDNFSTSKFNSTPPGKGAFIVKNSWGTSWGQNGYFYISYYDSILGSDDNSYQFQYATATTDYNKVYQYDPLGFVNPYGYPPSTIAWAANIFTATAADNLAAVSFYATSPGTGYDIYIYDKVSLGAPRSGTLVNTKSGTSPLAGYHVIALDSTYTLSSGQRFSVAIKFNTNNLSDTYPIAAEESITGYSSKATASSGQSYMWDNIISHPWEDVGTSYDMNVCIKAFTSAIHVTKVDNWNLYN